MFINTSKIQFESNSQLVYLCSCSKDCCLSIRQRYNLKAIHNYSLFRIEWIEVVYQYVKDTIWKQFTTASLWAFSIVMLFINTSKIQFESNSQLIASSSISKAVVYQYVKDTIWKQFTTTLPSKHFTIRLFINTSKIQFESNSQPDVFPLFISSCCLSIRQRYNLKAIHNLISCLIKK